MAVNTDNLRFNAGRGITVDVLFKTQDARDFLKKVRDACAPKVEGIANRVVDGAKANAAAVRITGQLEEGISAKMKKRGLGFTVSTSTKDGDRGHGASEEFGNSRHKKVPIIYPAYDKEMGGLLEELKDTL